VKIGNADKLHVYLICGPGGGEQMLYSPYNQAKILGQLLDRKLGRLHYIELDQGQFTEGENHGKFVAEEALEIDL
jgi:hypothetical protein